MTKVVGLEIQARGKGFLVVVAYLNADVGIITSMTVDAEVTFRDDDRSVDVAIVALGQCHLFDELVHQRINLRVFGDGIDRCAGL